MPTSKTLSGSLVTQRTLELLKFAFPSLTMFTTDFSDQTGAIQSNGNDAHGGDSERNQLQHHNGLGRFNDRQH